jgi:hypothetical protein
MINLKLKKKEEWKKMEETKRKNKETSLFI